MDLDARFRAKMDARAKGTTPVFQDAPALPQGEDEAAIEERFKAKMALHRKNGQVQLTPAEAKAKKKAEAEAKAKAEAEAAEAEAKAKKEADERAKLEAAQREADEKAKQEADAAAKAAAAGNQPPVGSKPGEQPRK